LREYLEYNGYKQTLTVFLPGALQYVRFFKLIPFFPKETGQPLQKPFKRQFLAHELQGAKVLIQF
jgi:lisH domain-containing protein FOPNL